MDELMRDHGGFEHNRQTLRILEVLEQPLPELPGPEPDLGGAGGDHQAPAGQRRHGARRVRARRGPDPGGPARRLRGRDRLQQPRRRRRARLGHVHGGADPQRWRSSARPTTPRSPQGIADERILRHQVVRRIINRCAEDLIGTTLRNLEEARVASVEDVRQAGRRLVGVLAGDGRRRSRELKEFLLRNMYRHYRVVRMGDKAGRILRDLFQSYMARAAPAPAAVPGADRARRRAPRRLRLHRGHDRPLRGGRAPEAVRPHGARLI